MIRRELSPAQQAARVKNAVAQFLFGLLIVPKVFFDARWPAQKGDVDVLAVDRSGAGEIHAVEVKVGRDDTAEAIRFLKQIPAHYKYLAFLGGSNHIPSANTLYAPDGMGRIGVIQVREDGSGNLVAEFLIRPERFRLDSSYFRQIDTFTSKRPADLEVRP